MTNEIRKSISREWRAGNDEAVEMLRIQLIAQSAREVS